MAPKSGDLLAKWNFHSQMVSKIALCPGSWRELDVVKVLKLITARRGVISFSTFTNSNDPFIIDFPPKTSLRKKSDNVSFDWNLFLIEGQVK